MKFLTPQRIAEVTGGEFVGDISARNNRVAGAAKDNREVQPGNMFVCIRGANNDGHSFANSAFEAGASCCLAERAIADAQGPYIIVASTYEAVKALGKYYRSLFDIPVIGVTGSVGKTTTKEMTASALGAKLNVMKTLDNMNNELGVPLTLLSLDESHEAAVIEMGISEFGAMSRLADMVRPNICIITKIGYSHLETLDSLDGVLQAKSEVFSYMDTGGVAVLNGDDELLRGYDPGLRKVMFGLGGHNDIRAENVRADGTRRLLFDIVSHSGRFEATVPSYGTHLASAALAATAVGRLLSLTDEEIARGFLSYSPVSGRANVADTGYITIIDDRYNANPNSVMSALSSLSALPNRRVAILGDMLELGGQSERLHREVGSFAARNDVDCLVCCGDMAAFIYEEYMTAGGKSARFFHAKNKLISAIPEFIREGDAVLVKASRGMKFEELLPYLNKQSE